MVRLKNSTIIYKGESLIDSKPIVAIATGFNKGSNSKLGMNVVQTYVVRSDMNPVEAVKTGQDASVCGNCPLRQGVCYVNVAFPVSQIYRAFKRGSYETIDSRYLRRIERYNKILRLTAYGEVGAIPKAAVDPLIQAAPTTLGYTHRWRVDDTYKGIVMASCETAADVELARSQGWQTFRVKGESDRLLKSESICTNQANKAQQCEDCRLCDGKTKSIAVDVHGLTWKKANYQKLQA